MFSTLTKSWSHMHLKHLAVQMCTLDTELAYTLQVAVFTYSCFVQLLHKHLPVPVAARSKA